MNNSFETNFVPQTVEKTPFVDMPAQNFFAEWCRINDSIVPKYIPRQEWEQRGVLGILEKNDQGGQSLFLPTDLHLWEMMDVIRTIDHDTLARNPDKRAERANQIQELGVTFEKAGQYLSEYLPILDQDNGRLIAQDIASEFYQYGLTLQNKKQETNDIPEESSLTQEDKTKLDEWFLGRDAYQKRITRLGENPSEDKVEDTRKRLLQVYFKALGRVGYKADGEKPWETRIGPIQHLQDRTKRQITRAIETPDREMRTAIFRRGVKKLVTGMNIPNWRETIQTFLQEGFGLDVATEKVNLSNSLELPRLKKELDEIRQTGDITKISAKELEIAKKIQHAVSIFPHVDREYYAYNLPEVVHTQFMNCVSSSILGGGLLDEVDIKYLHVDWPGHSATVLITSDGKVYMQDFVAPTGTKLNYVEITSDMLEGDPDLSSLTHIKDSGLTIEFKHWKYEKRKLRLNLFIPEIGLQCHLLNNTGNILNELGRYEEAVVAFQQAISLAPKFTSPYSGLANALNELDRNEEAVIACQQAISVDPEDAYAYNGLGQALRDLGRNEEAVLAYRQFIKLWNGDSYWIDKANEEIEKLQRK